MNFTSLVWWMLFILIMLFLFPSFPVGLKHSHYPHSVHLWNQYMEIFETNSHKSWISTWFQWIIGIYVLIVLKETSSFSLCVVQYIKLWINISYNTSYSIIYIYIYEILYYGLILKNIFIYRLDHSKLEFNLFHIWRYFHI